MLPATEHGRMSVCNLFRKSIVKERRRSPRVRLHGEVHLQISGLSLRIPAADISVSGVGVLLDEYVLAGKPSGEVGVCRIEAPELGGLRQHHAGTPHRQRATGRLALRVDQRWRSRADPPIQAEVPGGPGYFLIVPLKPGKTLPDSERRHDRRCGAGLPRHPPAFRPA